MTLDGDSEKPSKNLGSDLGKYQVKYLVKNLVINLVKNLVFSSRGPPEPGIADRCLMLFWDVASLPQPERSPEEDLLFEM